MIRSSLAATRLLRDRGVRYAFGVPGESFLGLLDALYETPEIELVTTRHEGGAGFMALAEGRLTELPGAVTGRWLPGRRAVLVSHDTGGDENAQLSVLEVEHVTSLGRPAGLDDLTPLLRAEGVMHVVLHLQGEHLVYAHNGRNRVDFDVHVRHLGTGDDVAVATSPFDGFELSRAYLNAVGWSLQLCESALSA